MVSTITSKILVLSYITTLKPDECFLMNLFQPILGYLRNRVFEKMFNDFKVRDFLLK